MAQQSKGRFRRFLSTTPGKIVILVLAFVVVFATNAYVSVVVAIPAILLFGLAVPIWAGLKRPRFLALLGLVVVLAVAPVVTVVFTQEILTPVGVANSSNALSASNGQPVMENATVHPFAGTTSTNFTWTVTIYPQNHPAGNTTPYSLFLYISSCPGATGNNSPVLHAALLPDRPESTPQSERDLSVHGDVPLPDRLERGLGMADGSLHQEQHDPRAVLPAPGRRPDLQRDRRTRHRGFRNDLRGSPSDRCTSRTFCSLPPRSSSFS